MQTCETCRYWERPKDGEVWRAGFGVCRGIAFAEDLAEASQLAEMAKKLEDVPNRADAGWLRERLQDLKPLEDQKAFTEDGSGYRADLRTRADFGCIAHESREEV